MNYPLISEYIESIRYAEDNFATLINLRPVIDDDGNPIMSSGNFAVVFKMKNEVTGKLHAVKCFLKEQEGRAEAYKLISEELDKTKSTYILPVKYLEKELFVNSNQSDETDFPILIMDWVEGQTLTSFLKDIEDLINENSLYWSDAEEYVALFELRCLPLNFIRMASWLIKQPFAHGDLKPDNIMITPNGAFVLVDYDGMYVPAMQGMVKQCTGTPNYRHPKERIFNTTLDNYAISVIALSLCGFALQPQRLFNSNDYCLISEEKSIKLHELSLLQDSILMSDDLFKELLAIYLHVISQNELNSEIFDKSMKEFLVPKSYDILDTDMTDFEQEHFWEDNFGVRYSLDGRKVLKASKQLKNIDYKIREGVLTICNQSFQLKGLNSIILPDSVVAIGDRAFANNDDMVYCNIPQSVKHIFDNNPWGGCFNIKRMDCFSPHYLIDDGILYSSNHSVVYGFIYWHSDVVINPNTKKISANAFWSSRKKYDSLIKNVNLSNVLEVGKAAFFMCINARFVIPESLAIIGKEAFYNCSNIKEINLSNLNTISEDAFARCDNLTKFNVKNVTEIIQENAFRDCVMLTFFNISKSTIYISKNAFKNCTSLQGFLVDGKNPNYCDIDGVLFNKSCTTLVKYPSAKTEKEYEIPSTVREIADEAFVKCKLIESIKCNNQLQRIGDNVFYECTNLKKINIRLDDNSDKKSYWHLGSILFSLKDAETCTKQLGYSYIDKAAMLEHSRAQLIISKSFKYGWYNNIVDNEKYIYWLERSASNNEYEAMCLLGFELTVGKLVPKNYIRAYSLFKSLEEAGFIAEIACRGTFYNYLGAYCEFGLVGEKNIKKAAEYYKEGCEWDDPLAEFNLAKLYEKGTDLNRDLYKAKKLYQKAKEHKHKDAEKALERIERLIMDEEELPF